GKTLNSKRGLETVLRGIGTKGAKLSGTEAGAIYVFNESSHEYQLCATYGMTESLIHSIQNQHVDLNEAVARAVEQRQPMQAPDLREESPSMARAIMLQATYLARLASPLSAADP